MDHCEDLNSRLHYWHSNQ